MKQHVPAKYKEEKKKEYRDTRMLIYDPEFVGDYVPRR